MGSTLRRPVTSVPITRRCGKNFCIGMAEMNGFRSSMEDSHVIHMADNWGFFGVLDGHGGSQCSGFIARRLEEELQTSGLPKDDAAVRALAFRLDEEFLHGGDESGSTATFAIVHILEPFSDLRTIRVGNIGDSRVLLGSLDGKMVEGFGTDGGLTTDHKPNSAVESERIEKAGGWVKEASGGVHRVNGELAVSRAFGDRKFKKCELLHDDRSQHPEDCIVSAEPEFFTTECDSSNFLLLVCDGISEGNFPNREVVDLAALQLRKHGDPARAAAAICRKALVRDSRDNLTCMVVLLKGDVDDTYRQLPEDELIPGEFWDLLGDSKFKNAYEKMAERGGSTLHTCVERRFDRARQDLGTLEALYACEPIDDACKATEDIFVWNPENGHDVTIEQKIKALQSEIKSFGDTPPALGSEERLEWFRQFVDSRVAASLESTATMDLLQQLLNQDASQDAAMLRTSGNGPADLQRTLRSVSEDLSTPSTSSSATTSAERLRCIFSDANTHAVGVDSRQNGTSDLDATMIPSRPSTHIRVTCDRDMLKQAFDAHPELAWTDRILEVCGRQGTTLEVDQDGTSHVRFDALSFTAWLPTSVLSVCFQEQDSVKVAKLEDLMQAVQTHPALAWDKQLEVTCDKEGRIYRVDDDGTACVQFKDGKAAWLPLDALTLC